MFEIVPSPSIQHSPSRFLYYTGEHLNVTCTSSVVGAVFTWSAVNDSSTQETLNLPNTISNGKSSVLVFKPIEYGAILVQLTCTVNISGNGNIITGELLTRFILVGKLWH